MPTKAQLRAHFRQLRDASAPSERACADERITAQVLALASFQRSDAVFTYLSFGSEVETRDIIEAAWKEGKRVALPRCIAGTRQMRWHAVESFDGLERSAFGIDEPSACAAVLDPAACMHPLVLVPGLAFDAQGYRLGYGGGYYDVFLATLPERAVVVGLCRPSQRLEHLVDRDPYDIPVDLVVS